MIDERACIGRPPESRDVRMTTPGIAPEIHPTAIVEAFATVDAGIERATTVGPRSWAMKSCHIGHDAQIGADCELAPKTVIGGYAILEDGVRCGIGALIRPRVRVGEGARVGMGAVVTKDVEPGATVVGNPARRHGGPVVGASEAAGWEAFVPDLPGPPPDPYEEWGAWWDRTRA